MTPDEKLDQIAASLKEFATELKTKTDLVKEENFKNSYKIETDFKSLVSKVDFIGEKIKQREIDEQNDKKDPKDKKVPWWGSLVSFMALPTAIVTLLLIFKQTENVGSDTALNNAQVENQKLEALEKRLKIITDSVSIAKLETMENRKALGEDINEINAILSEIKKMKSSNTTTMLINRFVVLYLFFIGIGLLFRAFNLLWHNFFNATYRYLSTSWSNKEWDRKTDEKQKQVFRNRQKYLQWAYFVISALPSIAQVLFDFAIITVVVFPLFDVVSSELQSTVTAKDIIQSMLSLDFSSAIRELKDVIF